VLESDFVRLQNVDGGWTPLRIMPLVFWFVTTTIPSVKIVQFVLILCNIATYAMLTRKLLGSNGSALVATAITLTAWQLRFPHDPTLGSSYQWPWLAELLLLSSYAILSMHGRRVRRALALALLSATAAALSEPSAWPVVMLLGVAALTSIRSTSLRVSTATAFVAIAVVVASAGIRTDHSRQSKPWARQDYARAVLVQVVAALPTTYRAFGNIARNGVTSNSTLGDTRFQEIPDVTASGWLAIILIVCGAVTGLREARLHAEATGGPTVVAIGLALWLGSAVDIGPHAIWRTGLPLGQSFDSVYVEVFGVGILGAWLLIRTARSRIVSQHSLAVGLSLVLLLFGMGNVRANAFAIEDLGRHDRTRSLVERAGADGFFAAIPVGSTLIVAEDSQLYDPVYGAPSDARNALFHYTGVRFRSLGTNALRFGSSICTPQSASACAVSNPNVYILTSAPPRSVKPQLALTRWIGIRNGLALTDSGHGFAAFPSAAAAANAAALLTSPQRGVVIEVPSNIEPAALAFYAKRTCGAVALAKLFDPAFPTISWGAGFYHAPVAGDTALTEAAFASMRGSLPIFRWAGSRADLIVRGTSCPSVAMHVSFSVLTSSPAYVDVRWPGGRERAYAGSLQPAVISLKLTGIRLCRHV
jgi:hypothetical protein